MAIVRILNVHEAASLVATPTVADIINVEPTTVLPLDTAFIEETLRALENRV